jgi:hypothetical protein
VCPPRFLAPVLGTTTIGPLSRIIRPHTPLPCSATRRRRIPRTARVVQMASASGAEDGKGGVPAQPMYICTICPAPSPHLFHVHCPGCPGLSCHDLRPQCKSFSPNLTPRETPTGKALSTCAGTPNLAVSRRPPALPGGQSLTLKLVNLPRQVSAQSIPFLALYRDQAHTFL